jgi:hypothetical protein
MCLPETSFPDAMKGRPPEIEEEGCQREPQLLEEQMGEL